MPSIKYILEQYAKQNHIPMHMPGHKRNPQAAPYLNHLSEQLDVTEIEGMDNLYVPNGMLKQAMERACKVWNSDQSYFLVNGSTCGILAGIRTLTRRGDQVLVMRNSHKSVFHAIELCGLQPVFLVPPYLREVGLFGSLSPEQVREKLEQHHNIRLVIITSPTYEGVISHVKEICQIAHSKQIPVLVDEAHGAHLDLHPFFLGGAVRAGADITVQSLHKTLPSLTQTAILHVKGKRVDQKRLQHQLSVFETSSPSYLLLMSMDGCVRELEQKKLDQWVECLNAFYAKASALQHLTIIFHTKEMFLHDPSKLIISTVGTNITGQMLSKELQKRNLQLEMDTPSYALAMTGLGDTHKTMHALASALLEIDQSCFPSPCYQLPPLPIDSEMAMLPERAMEQDFELVPPQKAIGRISAEYVWAYPPGIPLLIPGERISQDVLLEDYPLYSTRGCFPTAIAVIVQ